ncbi:MAG TPA: FAD-dependent monooxygenase [Gemmatimonadaceae bacterium]|nr:FAD-dependent monooxygenase [Gemmatimonadaceae bacterium]
MTPVDDGAPMREGRIAIIGAGLGGALLACLLGRAGFRVDVYDKRGDPRGRQPPSRRAINLGLPAIALEALVADGVSAALYDACVPMAGRVMHAVDGSLTFEPYGGGGPLTPQEANAVARSTLGEQLVEAAAAHRAVALHFDHELTDADAETGTFELVAHGRRIVARADAIIGADGGFSALRRILERDGYLHCRQEKFALGYKELSVPWPTSGQALRPDVFHLWPRDECMLIALPNRDGSFCATLFMKHEGDFGLDTLAKSGGAVPFFARVFPDALVHMPNLEDELAQHPTSDLFTVLCTRWHGGRAVLLGDACHAMLPFTGHGASAAFTDARVLADCLISMAPDWQGAFGAYAEARKSEADGLAQAGHALAPLLFALPQSGIGSAL